MSKFSPRGQSQIMVLNGSILNIHLSEQQHIIVINSTHIGVGPHEAFKDSQLNELLYVIIVIVFYATALMTLIITQIKRQRREGTEVDYYDEYLQRNSEVKQTCQTATNIVTKATRPPPALATAAFAAAAAGTLLGRVPIIPDETTENLISESEDAREHPVGTKGCLSSEFGPSRGLSSELGPSRGLYQRERSPMRDKSPMLESIPDEEA
ncbi:uncharacterized protein LOC131953214 [Physella acuta]|uniref:uncharacterized protein LOC131953214 n=1 Tax=Physella acuta TaxID=109671 RepID=UPI0027DE7CB6|nr:uncharacterized protein LOC131953214 [Physella acuta]XP_059172282.1 uncharacterized protein LOC131953214 [Physella acuta]